MSIGKIRHGFQFLIKPAWFAAFLMDGGLMKFPNVVLEGGPSEVGIDDGWATRSTSSRRRTASSRNVGIMCEQR